MLTKILILIDSHDPKQNILTVNGVECIRFRGGVTSARVDLGRKRRLEGVDVQVRLEGEDLTAQGWEISGSAGLVAEIVGASLGEIVGPSSADDEAVEATP